jgi:hypothetical protein
MGLGSGIRDPEKTYSGSRIQGSKRHRIPNPEHCLLSNFHNFIAKFYSARRKSFQGVIVTDFKTLGGWTVEKNDSLIK